MPAVNKQKLEILLCTFTDKQVIGRAGQVAIVVGIILNLINQGNSLFSGNISAINWLKLGLTFIVPFLVSAYSSARAKMHFYTGESAPGDALLSCSECGHEILIKCGEVVPSCNNHELPGNWQISDRSTDEIKRMEHELQSLALFPQLNPAPVLRSDPEGTITNTNQEALTFFDKPDLSGTSVQEIIPSSNKINFNELINNGMQEHAEVSINGKTILFHFRGIPELGTCQIYGADITNERKIQAQFESMALFARLNPEPVIRADLNGRVIEANPAAHEAFPEIAAGKPINQIIPDLESFNTEHHITTNQLHKLETQIESRIYRFMLRGISQFSVCQLYGTDITERRKAEQELSQQKQEIEESIRYASLIQSAALSTAKILNKFVSDAFILYLPRDIVSGDFYWVRLQGKQLYFTAADCTGHGVPGALLSMLGISMLNEISSSNYHAQPDTILKQLRGKIKTTLPNSSDGMDMALCSLNTETLELTFSGANNPLYLLRKGEIQIIKPDKMPIGKYADEQDFTTCKLQLFIHDRLYIFSDGYADQFGGPQNKKFKPSNLRRLLMETKNLTLAEQKAQLKETFYEWKNKEEQVDDVLIMGIEL